MKPTKVTLQIVNYQALRRQQRRWQLANLLLFLRRGADCLREIVLFNFLFA